MNLTNYIEVIRRIQPMVQCVYYDVHHWDNYSYNNQHITEKVKNITKSFPKAITRQDIVDCFRDTNKSLLEGFLMTMIWGHGSTEHGKADNRGPWKVTQMFKNYTEATNIITMAKGFIQERNLVEAHSQFLKMPRCRVSYFSKYLYFVGKALNVEKYPVILDARVTTSIIQLSLNEPVEHTLFKIQPSQDSQCYKTYVEYMHRIAGDISVDADQIEYFLFQHK